MIDYFENIRKNSVSKAPFNLWPFQLKFDLMCPHLIYRSFIADDDTITTDLFPGRNQPEPISEFRLSPYARARNLTIPKLHEFAHHFGFDGYLSGNKTAAIRQIDKIVAESGIPVEDALDRLASCIYWPEIEDAIADLPAALLANLRRADLID